MRRVAPTLLIKNRSSLFDLSKEEPPCRALPEEDKGAKDLSETVERLLVVERDGIGEYEKLVKTTEGFHQDLFGMLCRIMIQDSLKHIGILDFLKLKLRERQRPAKKRRAKAKN